MNRIRVWWVWRDVVIEIQMPAYQQTGIFNGKKHLIKRILQDDRDEPEIHSYISLY